MLINEQKIRNLLKTYGATDKEIENFMQDLNNDVEDKVEEAKQEFDNNDNFEKWD